MKQSEININLMYQICWIEYKNTIVPNLTEVLMNE